jgi:hypothetical protein
MPANKDLTADAVAASPVPFVVTHPCPACHGQGMVDGQTCRGCHATGVGRFFHGTKANLKPGALRVGSRSAVRGARGSFSSLDLSRGRVGNASAIGEAEGPSPRSRRHEGTPV